MKIALLAAAAMLATPLMAQTTPPQTAPAGDPAMQTSQPAATTPPTMTPDATTAPATSDASMSTPPAASTAAPMTTDGAAPMPMANGKLPWCRAGQYTGCREHENAQGKGLRKR